MIRLVVNLKVAHAGLVQRVHPIERRLDKNLRREPGLVIQVNLEKQPGDDEQAFLSVIETLDELLVLVRIGQRQHFERLDPAGGDHRQFLGQEQLRVRHAHAGQAFAERAHLHARRHGGDGRRWGRAGGRIAQIPLAVFAGRRPGDQALARANLPPGAALGIHVRFRAERRQMLLVKHDRRARPSRDISLQAEQQAVGGDDPHVNLFGRRERDRGRARMRLTHIDFTGLPHVRPARRVAAILRHYQPPLVIARADRVGHDVQLCAGRKRRAAEVCIARGPQLEAAVLVRIGPDESLARGRGDEADGRGRRRARPIADIRLAAGLHARPSGHVARCLRAHENPGCIAGARHQPLHHRQRPAGKDNLPGQTCIADGAQLEAAILVSGRQHKDGAGRRKSLRIIRQRGRRLSKLWDH